MKDLKHIFIALLALLLSATSCCKRNHDEPPYNRVFLMYSLAYNNLAEAINANVDQLCKGNVPDKSSTDIVLVFNHSTAKAYDYKTITQPCIYRIYKDGETVVRDTLTRYSGDENFATNQMVYKVLTYVKENFKAKHYGMLFSSHATGWVPHAYATESLIELDALSAIDPTPSPELFCAPMFKSLGLQATPSGKMSDTYGIEVDDFAGAIPMHMDYIIFDACLMGCVECAWELRNKSDYLLFSPTEIVTRGMYYENMLERLFSTDEPDLQGICNDFYYKYTSSYMTATLVKCSEVENLTNVFVKLLKNHRSGFDNIDRSKVQAYFYDNSKPFYYDLRDAVEKMGATASELSEFDAALKKCVVLEKHTDSFMNRKLERICGLSLYLPIPGANWLNIFYSTLSWNDKVGLVD